MQHDDPAVTSEHVPSWLASTVRPVAPRTARERAEHRLAELLRAHGLTDVPSLRATIERFLDGAHLASDRDVEGAVRRARARLDGWLPSILGTEAAAMANRERVRALLARSPELLLSPDVDPDWLRTELGLSRTMPPPRLPTQGLEVGRPTWLFGLVPSLLVAAVVLTWALPGGTSPAELSFVVLVSVLLALNAVAVMLSTTGLVRRWWRARKQPSAPLPAPATSTRTAVVIAIYNEESERVFAGVAAMRESLAEAGAERFEIFVVSDTRHAATAAAEERAVRRLRAGQLDSPVPLHYRRRERNAGYKSGNLADFLMRWGGAYDYVVVLDADSVVDGKTLRTLARRMDADPGLGLLQLPIEPVRAVTPFARVLQFVGQLYGPLFSEGLAAWSASAANYFGHNAIIRVGAFVESCGLPELSGVPPFGGIILSHDFVEAALLRRAGWKVEIAADLAGSYEELPPTLEDFVTRDRRWAQGNLQHLRVLLARGLAPMSRVHLLLGAMAYMSAPLWLAFLVLSALARPEWMVERGAGLTAAALVVLFWPKLMGLVDALRDGTRRRRFGGVAGLLLGWVSEVLVSACLAPLLMMHHVFILLDIAIGKTVGWSAQRRKAASRPALRALTKHGWLPLVGVAIAAATFFFRGPLAMAWLSPIWFALILAPLMSALGGSEALGRVLMRTRLWRVPTEVDPPAVLERLDELRVLSLDDSISRFRDLVLDPVLNELHCRSLSDDATVPDALLERALSVGPEALRTRERAALLASPSAMRRLHDEAWTTWPIERWTVGRESPLSPLEAPL